MESTKKIHQVREAVKDDCHQIMELIKMSARNNNMEDEVKIDAETLIRDGFTENKLASFKCLVSHDDSQQLSGYLIYCYSYSTWEGLTVLMVNIFVDPRFRKMGIGKRMITRLAQIAYADNVSRIDFSIHDWNKLAIDFHQSLGAINSTNKEGWHIFQYDKNVIQQVANKTLQPKNETHPIREAVKSDCHQIIEFMTILAHYHKDEMKIDVETLIRDAFSERNLANFKCLVSYDTDQNLSGFASYYYIYSAYEGRCIYVEDLFVVPKFRKMAIAKNMMIKIAKIAHGENVAKMHGQVIDWNQLIINFHHSFGGVNLTTKTGLNVFKFDKKCIQQLATDRENTQNHYEHKL